MSENIFDTRLIAQVQLARVGNGEKVLPPIMKNPKDESEVWVLSVNGYVSFKKQEIANAYAGFLTSSDS